MSGGLSAEIMRENSRRSGYAKTQFEQRGLKQEIGAPVTSAIAVGTNVAAGFGDGTVRFFSPNEPPSVVKAHRGVILDLCADAASGAVLTSGDDGRFLRVSSDKTIEEIASFGTKWVDCVASAPGFLACSSGRVAHVWRAGDSRAKYFEHPSTVGGLSFNANARRLAVSHYGGATVWERGDRRWKAKNLVWKGSHGAVAFSPDGKYVVTAMQENALHGWRLRDKADMRMSGYPAKIKSFAWVGSAPYLTTSGAEEAVCWPFDGKHGPMGRSPITCAYGGKQLCTSVAGLVNHDAVFAGFEDGSVIASRLKTTQKIGDFIVKGPSRSPIASMALTSDGWLFVGEEAGRILWAQLGRSAPTEWTGFNVSA